MRKKRWGKPHLPRSPAVPLRTADDEQKFGLCEFNNFGCFLFYRFFGDLNGLLLHISLSVGRGKLGRRGIGSSF